MKNNETKFKTFLNKTYKNLIITTGGMVYGLFATLILSVIVMQLGKLMDFNIGELHIGTKLNELALILRSLTGAGIGVAIALNLKKEGLHFISIAISGGVAGILSNNDPLVTYFTVIIAAIFIHYVFKKKTLFDIIIVPLTTLIIAYVFAYLISYPVSAFTALISAFITNATTLQPVLMGIILSVSMGILLTSPLSSAAIAISLQIGGLAGGAGLVGCVVNMLGFALQGTRKNKVGQTLAVAFGTSMLQFKNILKKPAIWLPTIITSALLGPLSTTVFKMETHYTGSGMGTSGLVGQFATFEAMGFTKEAWLSVIILQFALPLLIVGIIHFLFVKYRVYDENDLIIAEN